MSGGYCSLPCTGFSLQWLPLFQSMGSRLRGFTKLCADSSCSLVCGIFLDQISSPELAGRFLSHVPGKSSVFILLVFDHLLLEIFFFMVLQKDFPNFLPASVATPSWDILYLNVFLDMKY